MDDVTDKADMNNVQDPALNQAISSNDPELTAAAVSSDPSLPSEEIQVEQPLPEVGIEDLPMVIEALLLAHGEPLSVSRLADVCGVDEDNVRDAVGRVKAKLEAGNFGFELIAVADMYQFRTKAGLSPFVRQLKAVKPKRLSPPALETLAIVAYRQPVVKSDIEKIRGVDCTPTLKTLLERRLIRIVGHQATVGQPALYGTTEEFMKLFGLSSLSELPTLRDLKELEQDPGEGGAGEASEATTTSAPVERSEAAPN